MVTRNEKIKQICDATGADYEAIQRNYPGSSIPYIRTVCNELTKYSRLDPKKQSVWIVLQSSGFTSETQTEVYSAREKARQRFIEIADTISYDEAFEENDVELKEIQEELNILEGDNGLSDQQEAEIMYEWRNRAIECENFRYSGESDIVKEVSIYESEVK